MHTLWRTATLRGKYIVLESPLDEIDIHYADLENNVTASNAGSRKHSGSNRADRNKRGGEGEGR